jgi:hypothetical protein
MTSQRETLARLIVGEQVDAKERTTALRLQAKAWRLLAVIAVHDPAYAKAKIGWLFFVTVPYVDGAKVERFIEEHEQMAREYGELAGVFARGDT